MRDSGRSCTTTPITQRPTCFPLLKPDVCQPATLFFLSQHHLLSTSPPGDFTTRTSAGHNRRFGPCPWISSFYDTPPCCLPGPLESLFEDDCTRPTTRFQALAAASCILYSTDKTPYRPQHDPKTGTSLPEAAIDTICDRRRPWRTLLAVQLALSRSITYAYRLPDVHPRGSASAQPPRSPNRQPCSRPLE